MIKSDYMDWKIVNTLSCIAPDTFEGECKASMNGVTYIAKCTIFRSEIMALGVIIDVNDLTIVTNQTT